MAEADIGSHRLDSCRPDYTSVLLPIITEQDLIDYHATHFPDASVPSNFFIDPSTIAHLLPFAIEGSETVYEEEVDNDGLGYYADGVKRTLTDEQIAMFRHSELIQIERQQKMNAEDAKERAEEVDVRAKTAADRARLPSTAPIYDAHVKAHMADLQAQQHEESSQTHRQSSEEKLPRSKGRARKKEVPYSARHKRKWEGYIESEDPRHGSMTHRRMARELDEQQASSIEIDYGEETASTDDRTAQSQTNLRRVVSYADE